MNSLANGLMAQGVKKGDKIALLMKNSDNFIIVYYALMKLGVIAVPINFRLTEKEVTYILQDSDSTAVFFDGEYASLIEAATQGSDLVHVKIAVGLGALDGQLNLEKVVSVHNTEPNVKVNEWDDCEILYTSGTTGKPKGALFDHHRVLHVGITMSIAMKMGPEDNLLHVAPLFHSAQLNLFMVSGIYLGCTQYIHSQFDPANVLKTIEEYNISLFFAVPTMYNFLLQVPDKENFDLSSIKRCGYGAAPMPVTVLKQAMNLFKTDQFYNLCGLTEGGPGGILLFPEGHQKKMGAGGKAMLNTIVRIVHENGKDIAPGEVGEFIMRSETVMKRYYNKPEETNRVFRDGWLYTGDLATIDKDGYMTLVDRKKDMIITGGENVYSTEVEQVIYQHPKILESAVIGLPDKTWGEKVVAIIVPKQGETIDYNELKAFCRDHLATYKIPTEFIEEKEIPRNTSGKILKYRIREILMTKGSPS